LHHPVLNDFKAFCIFEIAQILMIILFKRKERKDFLIFFCIFFVRKGVSLSQEVLLSFAERSAFASRKCFQKFKKKPCDHCD